MEFTVRSLKSNLDSKILKRIALLPSYADRNGEEKALILRFDSHERRTKSPQK